MSRPFHRQRRYSFQRPLFDAARVTMMRAFAALIDALLPFSFSPDIACRCRRTAVSAAFRPRVYAMLRDALRAPPCLL